MKVLHFIQIDDKIANSPKEVCDTFNKHFVNVATNIGSPDVLNENDEIQKIIENHKNHSRVTNIKSMYQCDVELHFTEMSQVNVKIYLRH